MTNRRYSKEQLAAIHAKGGRSFFHRLRQPNPQSESLRAHRAEVMGKIRELEGKWSSITSMKPAVGEPGVYAKGRKGKQVRIGTVLDVERMKLSNAIGYRAQQLERIDDKLEADRRGRRVLYAAIAAGALSPLGGYALVRTAAGRRLVAGGLKRFRPLAPIEGVLKQTGDEIEAGLTRTVGRIEEAVKRKSDRGVEKVFNKVLGGTVERTKVGQAEPELVRVRDLPETDLATRGTGDPDDVYSDIHGAVRNALGEMQSESYWEPGYLEVLDEKVYRGAVAPLARKLGLPMRDGIRDPQGSLARRMRGRAAYEKSADAEIRQSKMARLIKTEQAPAAPKGSAYRGQILTKDAPEPPPRKIGRRKLEWRPPVRRKKSELEEALKAQAKTTVYDPSRGPVVETSKVDVRLQDVRSNVRRPAEFEDEIEKLRSIPRDLLSPRSRARLEMLERQSRRR